MSENNSLVAAGHCSVVRTRGKPLLELGGLSRDSQPVTCWLAKAPSCCMNPPSPFESQLKEAGFLGFLTGLSPCQRGFLEDNLREILLF